jgi:hypothetical protein
VRAPGLESARIASTQAQINVRPWEGELRIEATLESGKTVRALASASGPRTLRLDGPAAPDAGGVVRRRPSPAPVPPPDLHDNPYGER